MKPLPLKNLVASVGKLTLFELRSLPLIVGSSVLAATLLLWQSLEIEEQANIEQKIQLQTASVKNELTARLDIRIQPLIRMTERWQRRGKTVKEEWEFEAKLNLRDFKGYQAIQWVDPSLNVRWIVPVKGNEISQNFNLRFEKHLRTALEAAQKKHKVIVTPSIELMQGGKGFEVAVPIFQDKSFRGFIVGVFRTQVVLNTILEAEKSLAPGYAIAIFEGNEEIYRRANSSKKYEQKWVQEAKINLYNLNWRVKVWPKPQLRKEYNSFLPEAVLCAGILMSSLLAVAVHLAQTAKLRAQQTELANKELEKEIAERKQVQEALSKSEERFQAFMNNSPILAFIKDDNGRYIYVNQPLEHLFKAKIADLRGKTDFDWLPLETATQMRENDLNVISTNQPTEVIETIPTLDGYSHFWLVCKFPFNDVAGRQLVGGVAVDVTARQQAEVEMYKALAKEKELSELKSHFVSTTSHEFRTPLATILSSADMLELYSHKWAETKKIEHLHRIQTAAEQMTQLLDDVLLASKAEAGKLQFQPNNFDLTQFCQNLTEEMQLIADSKNEIKFIAQAQCNNVCLDERLLRHILTNLLSNAIKYSPQGTAVEFQLECDGVAVSFTVKDYGIGIPPADQSQLFQSFHRASNVGTTSGTGLGLSIVKKAVDVHGGEITFTSQVGVGTTFTVTIPLQA